MNVLNRGSSSIITTTARCIRHTFHRPIVIIHKRPFSDVNTAIPSLQFPPIRPRLRSFSRSFSACSSVHQESSASSFSASSNRPLVPWPTQPNPTPYEIFNLPRSASQQEIKARYFLLVKQYHPDHAPTTPVDRFRKVVEAYKILSQPLRRQEWDTQNPTARPSEFRQPWSGSRLSRRKTEPKGPPPSGGWSFGGRSHLRSNFDSTADNEHFNYERYYRRNLEQEMKIKRRMDELHAHRVEYERQSEQNRQTARIGLVFTGGLFLCVVMFAKAMTS
jgi:DnaJ domain